MARILFVCRFSSILDSLDVEFIFSIEQFVDSSFDFVDFFAGTVGSFVTFLTAGGVVRVRLLIGIGIELFMLVLLLAVVIERDRNLDVDDDVCVTDGLVIVGGRMIRLVDELFIDVTARVDVGIVASFFVFDATDVVTLDFFTGVICCFVG